MKVHRFFRERRAIFRRCIFVLSLSRRKTDCIMHVSGERRGDACGGGKSVCGAYGGGGAGDPYECVFGGSGCRTFPRRSGQGKSDPPQPAGAGGAELAHRSLVAGVAVEVLRLSSSDSLRMTAAEKSKKRPPRSAAAT